ncbi:uncharacterized protein PgNI_03556 [Pyricularia grisea]|uniref:Major facilitator superfamily (MFS) profile domain-containing protein n=1 Tax=Pyricularia grisea TaxID=148305 RepID=A0A6P8BFC2_PYRGI|nr:uncharacterized protein PgNI_03556 [Pyricularia grisea]TLD14412.1 hypothetical protein PgNI_03556 [Pyricularia grisea]
MESLADLARVARRAQEDAQRAAEAPSPVEPAPAANNGTGFESGPKQDMSTPRTPNMAIVPPLIQDLRLGSAPPSAGLPLPPLPAAAKSPSSISTSSAPGSTNSIPLGATNTTEPTSVTTPARIAPLNVGQRIEISPDYRPKTSSTKRLSFGSAASSKRPIKYARGGIELSPQPSDDDNDPLNWPLWKKDLNLAALLLTVALIQVMKTVFVSVNVVLEQTLNRSYTAIAALTGAPLIFSALTGMVALVASRVYGKRPVYLAATALIFFSSIWNAAATEFNNVMAARIFQGMGWGVFDSLVLGSIHDTFFEHERGLRVAIYQIVSVGTLWGGPLLGGVASQNPASWQTQFQILCSFQAVSVLLVALAVPETAFDRAFVIRNTPSTAGTWKQPSLRPRGQVDIEKAREYLMTMKPVSYNARDQDRDLLLQAPRAMIAPTTIMLVSASFIPFSALWSIASSFSMLFAHLPFNMSPSQIGALMAGPFILGVLTTAFFSLTPFWQRIKSCPKIGLIALATGSILTFVATLAMGLYTQTAMATPMSTAAASSAASTTPAAASETSPFMIDGVAKNVSFPALGFLLGLLAAGAYTLDATVRPTIRRSTSFTSSNLGIALRNTVDMEGAVSVWRALIAGIFVIGTPNISWTFSAMAGSLVGFAVTQMLLIVVLGFVWWRFDQDIIRWDGVVMKLVDLGSLKRSGSYMDMD